MNKLEANISLLFITFFAAIQNVFLIWIPESVSHFAFLCITNLVGFMISLAFFFGELFRLDIRQVKQSMILSAELVVFNIFMLLGVAGAGPTMTNALLSTDFVFISFIAFLQHKQLPDMGTVFGIISVLCGLLLMVEADFSELWNWHVLYLIVSDIAFAFYIVTTGAYSSSSNPSIIAMGQMFFCFVFSLILWACEAVFFGVPFSLPTNPEFWGSVIYVSFFIRGLYGIVQVYAQRYISPLNTSLIFSTEIIMTMAMSPVLTAFLGTEPEIITFWKVVGGVFMILGVLMADQDFFSLIRRVLHV